MKLKNRLTLTFFALLAVVICSFLLVAGKGNTTAGVAAAAAQSSNAQSAVSAQSPLDASWAEPVPVVFGQGYDNNAMIAASPINGAVSLFWGNAPGDNTGSMVECSNLILGGEPFICHGLDRETPAGLNNVIASAHDSLGRRHAVYWAYTGGFCNHYVIMNLDGSVAVNEAIPGSCDSGTPRKIGAMAIDTNNTAHIVLARNNVTGSMLYWQRTLAGTYPVIRESVAPNCCFSDLAIGASTQGTVMVAFKSTGISGSGTDIFTTVRGAQGGWGVANDISAACCNGCPSVSGAYLPYLAADGTGGLRIAWSDGRCYGGGPTDVYYRAWVPGTGWDNQPIVQVVNNSGMSYWPNIAVDASGVAQITWSDTTSSGNYRIFYSYGSGTVFSHVDIPFDHWSGGAFQKQSAIDYADGYVFVSFSANKFDPNKDNFYSFLLTAPPLPTSTPTPIPAPCAGERFHDVCPGTYYYTPTLNLNDAGIISGYNSTPPCPNSLWVPCFLPFNNATRAQMAKIIVLAAELPINTQGFPHFADVDASNVFSTYIETAFNNGVINGYACGGLNEPCNPPSNLPYFRPGNNVTRGQITKMIAIAFNFNSNTVAQTFEDVPPGSTFYTYTQQVADLGLINGYPCGGVGEPCNPPSNRPYFRPNNNVTRGQAAKIIDGARNLPAPTPTPTATSVATDTPTPTETATEVPGTPSPTTTAEATVTATSTAITTTTPTVTVTGTPNLSKR